MGNCCGLCPTESDGYQEQQSGQGYQQPDRVS